MKIVQPSFTILSPIGDEMLKSIEQAGRTCYKSEDKTTEDSAREFVRMLIRRGHESVLEHEKITIRFVCDRGVSHELVRHRLASFSQESTRYCNYAKGQIEVILPPNDWWHPTGDQVISDTPEWKAWVNALQTAERSYMELLKEGWTPQQARSVLPNSLKTEIVVTANLREWRLILKQRTAAAAHPQMRELMCPLLDELKNRLPEVFEDIGVDRLNPIESALSGFENIVDHCDIMTTGNISHERATIVGIAKRRIEHLKKLLAKE